MLDTKRLFILTDWSLSLYNIYQNHPVPEFCLISGKLFEHAEDIIP